MRDYLVKTGSKLAQQIETEPFRNILEAMELLAGPREAIYPRNVALMMFNDHPEKFFPYLQVDITIFPKGKLKDPDNFIEVPPINRYANLPICTFYICFPPHLASPGVLTKLVDKARNIDNVVT